MELFSPKIAPATLCGLLILLSSCYKNHLYVQQEWVDAQFLASSHIGTPDPRQAHPPEGQRLLVGWLFPSYQELTLVATVRFWDNEEEVRSLPIQKRWGSVAFYFPHKRILTYRVQLISEECGVVETWNHHFWTELIDIDKSNSAVSSQPKQPSVIETP